MNFSWLLERTFSIVIPRSYSDEESAVRLS